MFKVFFPGTYRVSFQKSNVDTLNKLVQSVRNLVKQLRLRLAFIRGRAPFEVELVVVAGDLVDAVVCNRGDKKINRVICLQTNIESCGCESNLQAHFTLCLGNYALGLAK